MRESVPLVVVLEPGDLVFGVFEDAVVDLEELLGDRFHAECDCDGFSDGFAAIAVVVPHVGDLLDHRVLELVFVGYYSLQSGPTAGEIGVDHVQLVAVSVGEQQ